MSKEEGEDSIHDVRDEKICSQRHHQLSSELQGEREREREWGGVSMEEGKKIRDKRLK